MKLHFAYTGNAYATAGLTLPTTTNSNWQSVGSSPFIQLQGANNVIAGYGDRGLRVNVGYSSIAARIWDLLTKLKPDEVLTFGCKVEGLWFANNNVGQIGLRSLMVNEAIYPVMYSDFATIATGQAYAYVEVAVDPTARTVTGYINGIKTRTLPIPANETYVDVNLVFLNVITGQSRNYYFDHFYAGIFNKSEGSPYLGAWECEELAEVSNELRDPEGYMTLTTIQEQEKSVVYALPEQPLLAVAVDVQATNPQLRSKLTTTVSDGVSTNTTDVTNIQSVYLDGEFSKTNRGRTAGAITPADTAEQCTVKMKAQLLEE